jgi:gliding motility-associated-like protein
MKKILLFTSILFLTITTSLFAQHPTALVSSNITSTSVDLSWDASVCSGNVHQRYRIVGGATWTQNNNVTSPYLLTGLLANTDYEWTVKCVGTSGWQINELFTTLVVGPTISNAFISQSILCNGDSTGEMQVEINQTSTPTQYSCIVGYYPFSNSYFLKLIATNPAVAPVLNFAGLAPDIDYCIRLVDSAAYYFANGGFANGFSTTGVYDEFCAINFSQPAQLVASTSVVTSNSCVGDCIAAEDLLIYGGTGPYSFSLDGGIPQNLASGVSTYSFVALCADTSDVVVTDANGCSTLPSNTSLIIPPIPPIVPAGTSSIVTCNGASDGTITAAASGGSGGFTYSINGTNFQSSAIFSGLSAGIYTITYKDANGCINSETILLAEPASFLYSTGGIPEYCNLSDGQASITVTSGGTGVLSYIWNNNPLEIDSVLDALVAGVYTVVVTDGNNCSFSESVTVLDGDPIVIDSLVVTNFSCYGIDDAQIEIDASGGTEPYSYSITNGLNSQPDPIFDTLAPDTYTLMVIDANGCINDTSITFITLSYPDQLAIDSTVFTHISCFGLDDGAVQNIQFVGGTSPFEFSIDGNPTQTYMLFSGLAPGQHTVEVFDINNCASSDYITVIEPTLFEVETTASNWNNYQIRCNGDSLGYVDIISSGGTAPYLTDGITFSNTITIDSLWAGNHTFVVQDANGCTYQDSILFQEPSPIQHNFISTHINCAAWNNGSVIDSVYGGVGSATTYSYLWDSGETTYSLANLTTGTYAITVTDENGCEDTESVIINDNNVFDATQGAIANVGCFDDCDGELSVMVLGGIPFTGLSSYNYLWNDYLGQNTDTAVGLCVDSIALSTDYYCVVSDAVGCSDTINFTLTQPAELQVDVSIISPISCNGLSDGKLKANVTGGELAYSYAWSNGGNSSLISNLSLGIYKVIVEDANTCRDTFEIYLNEPTLVEISIQEFDISCFGDNDGSIEVLGTGGTSFEATYSYTLYSGAAIVDQVVDYESGSISQTPFIFTNLSPGNYYVIAEDRNGCEVTSLSVEITEPFEPLTLLVDTVDETCLLNDGIIRIFPEGGSQSFNYFINGTPTLNNSNIIGGNAPGWYAITVIDTRGCEINDVAFIKDYRKIFLPDTLSNIDTTICLGQSVIIDVDENSELSYSWNDGVETGDRIIMPEVILAQGENATVYYTLTITDVNDCEQENIVVVHFTSIDPMLESDPAVEYGVSPIVLAGDNINLFSENNNCIEYTWQWSNDTITNANSSITIQELSETDWYYLKVKDADGCLGYDSIYVIVGVKPYEAITPNNDGFNDTWTPLDIWSYQNALVQVFNRWGGLVFESSGGNNYQAWDGTNNGKELVVGTYYYIIDLNTGDEPQTGPVTIIR